MRLRFFWTLCFLLISMTAFAQTGTVTGTLADTTGAVLLGVSIVATNVNTGSNYDTVSTETGNYVLTAAASERIDESGPGFQDS